MSEGSRAGYNGAAFALSIPWKSAPVPASGLLMIFPAYKKERTQRVRSFFASFSSFFVRQPVLLDNSAICGIIITRLVNY